MVRIEFKQVTWKSGVLRYTCCIEGVSFRITDSPHIQECCLLKSNKLVSGVGMSNNSLKRLPTGIGQVFINLIALDLSNCDIEEVKKRELKGLEGLKELSLRNNKIVSLAGNLFEEMKNLSHVSFESNKIENIGFNLLTPLKNLEHANFTGNVNINIMFTKDSTDSITLNQLNNIIETQCSIKSPPLSCVGQEISELWNTGKLSDFTICVDGTEFRVHKIILAMKSPIFAAMFETKKKQEGLLGRATITDISSEIFMALLDYIYCRQMPTENNAIKLYEAACKFMVDDLKIICEKLMLETMDETNAVNALKLCNLYENEAIKNAAFEEIRTLFPDKTLSSNLMSRPDDITKLIVSKNRYENFFKQLNR